MTYPLGAFPSAVSQSDLHVHHEAQHPFQYESPSPFVWSDVHEVSCAERHMSMLCYNGLAPLTDFPMAQTLLLAKHAELRFESIDLLV